MDFAVAEIGSTANSYQVLAKLATGGMAEIFLARNTGVGAVQRYVVLKRVLRERATDIHFMRMFLEEARLAAQLQHPNIAQVYDVGKLGDSYFFTMEYVHGETIRTAMQRAHQLRRSPPIGCVLAIAAGAAAGLHHAHERIGIEGVPLGIVHRDVSPTNLMIAYDGSVKVVDFGVAKATDRIQETHSGAVKGKISYLSPEQARGQKLDRRSDLFSLGIVMWELLTVERLYKHDSDFETMAAIIGEPPPAPSSRRRDIPAALDELVLRALAKSPDDRFQTADELGEAIERVAVQTSSPLSAAGVSRFLRELFGARPEPWVALQTAPRDSGPVTVTSEPIPAEIRIPISDPIDRRLAAVVDLSTAAVVDFGAPRPIEAVTASVSLPHAPLAGSARPPTRPGEPAPVTASIRLPSQPSDPAIARSRPPTLPSEPIPRTPSDPAIARSRPPTLPGEPIPRTPTASRPALPRPPTAGDPARPTPFPAASDSLRQSLPALGSPEGAAPSSRLPVILGVISAALAVAIAIVVAFQSDDSAPSPPARAASPVVDAPGPAPTVTPIEGAVDAAAAPNADAPREAAPEPAPKRPRVRTVKPDVARLVDAGRYADAIAECTTTASTDRAPCTLAACRAHDAAHARAWFARVAASQRARLVKACKAAGVVVDKDCQADPMACPR